MPIELRNIPGRDAPQGYQHVSIASGQQIIHLAGQVGADEAGALPAGLAAQAENALLNIGRALEAADASEADLVKLTVYVVDWDPSKFPALGQGLLAARAKRPSPEVPMTVVGVSALFTPDMLIEIEGVAVR